MIHANKALRSQVSSLFPGLGIRGASVPERRLVGVSFKDFHIQWQDAHDLRLEPKKLTS
jgi:hypothetical protein